MIITIYFEADHKKLVSSQRSSIFGPQKGHFGQSGPRNGPPGGQTATYRKTEVNQSYLRIWGTYDPIETIITEHLKDKHFVLTPLHGGPRANWLNQAGLADCVLLNKERPMYVHCSEKSHTTKLTKLRLYSKSPAGVRDAWRNQQQQQQLENPVVCFSANQWSEARSGFACETVSCLSVTVRQANKLGTEIFCKLAPLWLFSWSWELAA